MCVQADSPLYHVMNMEYFGQIMQVNDIKYHFCESLTENFRVCLYFSVLSHYVPVADWLKITDTHASCSARSAAEWWHARKRLRQSNF